MTTYARKIAEAVRDAAIDAMHPRLDHQEIFAAAVQALDLDAIIAGVPGPDATLWIDPKNFEAALKQKGGALRYLTLDPDADDVPLYTAPPQPSQSAASEAARDAKDAKRYRWLRDISEPGICAFYLSVGKAFDGVKFKRATVDEAIDAQIERLGRAEGE